MSDRASGNPLQLLLGTGAFAFCFAVFGSVSAMMPMIRESMALDPIQVSVGLATPVLLGSLGRIPLGLLTDRLGGRLVFSLTMAVSALAAFVIALATSYGQFLVGAFFLGISLASFSVGVPFVSRWYPPERQGFALGIYGAGNAGQSLAAFGAPVLAGALGYVWGFWSFGILVTLWLVFFLATARDAPALRPGSLADSLRPLRQPMAWVLSLFYFLTFGGFVAMSIYLPIFLTQLFELSPTDAGMRTAGFVVLATLMRPLGGILSDRVGGRRVLLAVFPAAGLMALLLTLPSMLPFTLGALGLATAFGLGNGAVFKLVPQYFPRTVGSVTGLVGAAGGLGGFFPPLVVGTLHQALGSFSHGFVLLACFSGLCLVSALRLDRVPAAASGVGLEDHRPPVEGALQDGQQILG